MTRRWLWLGLLLAALVGGLVPAESANTVKHGFVCAKPDPTDVTLVNCTHWNSEHAFAGGATDQVLVWDAAQTDKVRWTNVPPFSVAKAGDTMTGALTLPADPTSALHAATKQYVDAAPFVPRSYLAGLRLANNATDATNDIDIAVGMAEAENARGNMMSLTSALVKQIDATWVVGTNQGCLDTGAVADSTWYHVHLIQRSDTNVEDVLCSLSATAPTMPPNYDRRRRIGSIRRGVALNVLFYQVGDYFGWDDPPLDVNVTDPGTGATARTLTVATGVVVEAHISAEVDDTGNSARDVYLSAEQANDEAPSGTAAPLASLWSESGTARSGFSVLRIHTNSLGQIRSRLGTSAAGVSFRIATLGYTDRRGRDD